MTEPTPLTPAQARLLTDNIRLDLESAVARLTVARQRCAHTALGYASWHGYVTAELGDLLRELHLPKAERLPLVASMTEAGMSVRETAGELAVSKSTVQNDRRELASVSSLDDHRATQESTQESPPEKVLSSVDLIVAAVTRARDGLTVHEAARRLHWRQGQSSCALSRGEKRGRLARTGRFRDGCAVYVVVAAAEVAA